MTPLLLMRLAVTVALTGAWPLSPHHIARGYEPPTSTYASGHRGIDLSGRVGEAVRTALGGTVTFVGQVGGTPTVVVTHGSVRTTYQPVRTSVAVGHRVETGSVIGHLLTVHSHCLPEACLHWGYRRGRTYLNPLALVEKVRLLP